MFAGHWGEGSEGTGVTLELLSHSTGHVVVIYQRRWFEVPPYPLHHCGVVGPLYKTLLLTKLLPLSEELAALEVFDEVLWVF